MLSQNVLPVNYQIDLNVDMNSLFFSGHETIEIYIRKPCNSFKLNAADLKIKQCNFKFKLDTKKLFPWCRTV